MLLIKVCGMKDVNNITELIKVSPDLIGFIFHENSPRNIVDIPKVNILNTISKVGVFVNKHKSFIAEKVIAFNLDYVQLHGIESPEFCKTLKENDYKIIKAFNIYTSFDFAQLQAYESYCDYFLFDSFGKKSGGNGITFNWNILQNYKGKTPFFLSGGIDEKMTKEIKKVNHSKLIGVDINSGFEIEPGIKNIEKIKLFSNELRN